MFEGIKGYLNQTPEIAGVELLLLPEGRIKMRLVVLSTRDGKVQKTLGEYEILSYKELQGKLPKNTQVALSISGKGTVHRKIRGDTPAGSNKISAVLPGVEASDFYIQEFKAGEDIFLSLARKDLVDSLLEQFDKENILVTNVSFGPFAIKHLLPLIQLESDGEITMGHHTVAIKAEGIDSYEWMEGKPKQYKNLKVANTWIDERLLVAYASAFQLAIENEDISVPIEAVRANKSEWHGKSRFKRNGTILLATFLLLLLVNFGLFMYYSPYTSLVSSASLASSESELGILRSEVKEKDALLQKLGWEGNSGISYMADRIASTVPAEMALTLLALNPIDERLSRQERKPVFQSEVVHIAGNCKEVSNLNEWIRRLRQLDFCTSVTVTSYEYIDKDERGEFMLTITTGND